MKPTLFAALAIALAITSTAQSQSTEASTEKPFYLLMITSPDWQHNADESRLIKTIQSATQTSPLRTWVDRSVVKHMTTDDPIYRSRIAKAIPPNRLPVIAVMHRDGRTFYKASGANVPRTGYQLGRSIDYYFGFDSKKLVSSSTTLSDSITEFGPLDFEDDPQAGQRYPTWPDRCPPDGCRPRPYDDRNPWDRDRDPWDSGGDWMPDSADLGLHPMGWLSDLVPWLVGGFVCGALLLCLIIAALLALFYMGSGK